MALEAWTRTESGLLRRPLAGGELSVHAVSSKLALAHVIAGCTLTGIGGRSTDKLVDALRSGVLAIRFRWPNIACEIVGDEPRFEYRTPSAGEAAAWAERTVRVLERDDAADAVRALNTHVAQDSSFTVWLDGHGGSARLLCARSRV